MEQDMRLPGAELDVMAALWATGGAATAAALHAALLDGKGWGMTTVLNFLARLSARGFVSVEKVGRKNEYRALVSREDYTAQAVSALIDRLYGGSMAALVSVLHARGVIADADLARLGGAGGGEGGEEIPHWLL